MDFRQQIDAARRERGWSYARLAREAGLTGANPGRTVQRYLTGGRDTSGARIAALMAALGLDVRSGVTETDDDHT